MPQSKEGVMSASYVAFHTRSKDQQVLQRCEHCNRLKKIELVVLYEPLKHNINLHFHFKLKERVKVFTYTHL